MTWKKKLAIFITGVTMLLCAGLGFWLGVNFITPAREYRQAEEYIEEDRYDEAVVVFQEIADGYDTELRLAQLLGYADAAERVTQTRYEKGVYLREQGEYEASAELFDELGDYADSADQAANARLLIAQEWIEAEDYAAALELLDSLDGYDGGEFGSAQELTDQAHYERGTRLAAIGKLENAEADLAAAESYSDAWENLREVRYNLARNALLLGDFETAATYLEKITTYEDAQDLLSVAQSAVDKVYETVYTDVSGNTVPGITSYLWVYTSVVPGELDEGVSVQMLEDMTVGEEVDPAVFGAISTTYALELVRDADTWYFTYYGSDSESSEGALVLEAEFSEDYSALTTRKVYASVRDAEIAAEAEAAAEEEEDSDSESGDDSSDSESEDDESGEDEESEEDGESDSKKSAADGDEDAEDNSEEDEGDQEDEDEDEETAALDEDVKIRDDEEKLAEGELDQEEEGEDADSGEDDEEDTDAEDEETDADDEDAEGEDAKKDAGDSDGDEDTDDEEDGDSDGGKDEDTDSAGDADDEDADSDSEDDEGDEEDGDEVVRGPEADHERTWSEVTDEELADLIRECFRTKLRLKLAENGNMAFSNDTADERLTHYCDVDYCLNEAVYMAQDDTSRRYYCEEHEEAYQADPAFTE